MSLLKANDFTMTTCWLFTRQLHLAHVLLPVWRIPISFLANVRSLLSWANPCVPFCFATICHASNLARSANFHCSHWQQLTVCHLCLQNSRWQHYQSYQNEFQPGETWPFTSLWFLAWKCLSINKKNPTAFSLFLLTCCSRKGRCIIGKGETDYCLSVLLIWLSGRIMRELESLMEKPESISLNAVQCGNVGQLVFQERLAGGLNSCHLGDWYIFGFNSQVAN